MAIEGAVLRETLRSPGTALRWIDGSQNRADVLTKLGVDKTYLYKVLREVRWTLVKDPAAAEAERQQAETRTVRKQCASAETQTLMPKQPSGTCMACTRVPSGSIAGFEQVHP